MVATVNGYTASTNKMYITILNVFLSTGRDAFLSASTGESDVNGADIGA